MKFVRIITLVLLFLLQLNAFAQFRWAQIGVDGLTCSACSRSVEMSIRKLDFVDSVKMNLKQTQGRIVFKKDMKVEVEKISKAVTDAGFSVRSLSVGINIEKLKVSNDLCWIYENDNYHFIKIKNESELKGLVTLKLIGIKYMPRNEYKNFKPFMNKNCIPPVLSSYSRNYYVTIP